MEEVLANLDQRKKYLESIFQQKKEIQTTVNNMKENLDIIRDNQQKVNDFIAELKQKLTLEKNKANSGVGVFSIFTLVSLILLY